MRNLRHFHFTAELFFFGMGFLYCIALLLWKNEVFLTEMEWFFELADIPFLLVSLAYFLSSIRLDAEEKYRLDHGGEKPEDGFFSFLNTVLFLFGGGIFFLFFLLDVVFPFLQNPEKGTLPFMALFS